MYLPSASAFLRMVSRKATLGSPTLASTLCSRFMRSTRISRCSSPMPLMMVWPGLLVGAHLEGGVLVGQPRQRNAHLFLVGLGLGLDGHRDHRLREGDGAQRDGVMRVAQRVAGLQFLHAHAGADVAGQNLGHVLALVGVHLHQAADALGLAGAGIENRVAGLERAGVDADKAQLAEGIVDDLEGQGRQRLVVVRLAGLDLVEMARGRCPRPGGLSSGLGR